MASKIKVDQIQTADGSGTIALQNQLSGMTSASMPTGSVLQVVNTSTTAEQSTTSESWVDTNLSLSITPSATTSKIHIQYSFQSVTLPLQVLVVLLEFYVIQQVYLLPITVMQYTTVLVLDIGNMGI